MAVAHDSRSVTAKVLAILGAFSQATPELTLGQIARAAGVSKPTAHRRIAELIEWGALEKRNDGRISVGMRLWEVGAIAPRALPLRELALPCLEDLMAFTGGNSQLAVLDGKDALFIERLRGKNKIPALTAAANRLPLLSSGVGLALLAHAPDDFQDEVVNESLARYTDFTITEPAQLRERLVEARRVGYGLSDRQLAVDCVSIGAPIFAGDGTVTAAIGVVYNNMSIDATHVGNVVVTFARALSRILGARFNGSADMSKTHS